MNEDKVIVGVAVVMLLVICGVLFFAVAGLVTDRRCLAAGYPHGRLTYALDQYCIKRVNQTDVVVPFVIAERVP